MRSPLFHSERTPVRTFFFALILCTLQTAFGQAPAFRELPFPKLSHPSLARGREAITADPGGFITVGRDGCEFRSIAEALAQPREGLLRICLMDGVHRESGIQISGDVELYGFGAARTVLEAAARPEEAVDRVIKILPEGRLFISGLTVRGGRAQDRIRNGGGIANYGSLTIEDCAIVENEASAGAGVWTAGALVMRRCLVAANRTVMRPAADYSAAVGCRGSGGGVKVDKPGDARIEDSLIAWNSALKGGGGIHIACETRARLIGSTIFGNTSGTRGGGVDLSGGTLELERCTIAGNRSTGRGFAVYNRGHLSLTGCLLASEIGTAYFRAVDSGGEWGSGSLIRNEGNYCQSGTLPGAAAGLPGDLVLADNGGPTWTVLPAVDSPARGYGTPDAPQRP